MFSIFHALFYHASFVSNIERNAILIKERLYLCIHFFGSWLYRRFKIVLREIQEARPSFVVSSFSSPCFALYHSSFRQLFSGQFLVHYVRHCLFVNSIVAIHGGIPAFSWTKTARPKICAAALEVLHPLKILSQNTSCTLHSWRSLSQYGAWAAMMSLWNFTLCGLNLASVTELKRIQTPHSLCCDFWGDKTFTTRWSGYRVQVWFQVWAPACHLLFQKAIKGLNSTLEGKINGQTLGAASGTAWEGLIGKHKHKAKRFQVGGSRCWPQQACLRKTCYHSCHTDSVQESKRF